MTFQLQTFSLWSKLYVTVAIRWIRWMAEGRKCGGWGGREGGFARATPVFHLKLAEREWVMMPYFKCYNQMHTKWKYSGFFALIFVLLTPNMWVGCRYFFCCCMYLNLVITVLHTYSWRLIRQCNELGLKLNQKLTACCWLLSTEHFIYQISNKMFMENHKP